MVGIGYTNWSDKETKGKSTPKEFFLQNCF